MMTNGMNNGPEIGGAFRQMVLADFKHAADCWRTGVPEPALKVSAVNQEFPAIRSGWTGLAFTWSTFCVNVLQVGDRQFMRGWGMQCPGELECRVQLTRPARDFSVSAALNFSHSLARENWDTEFQIRDEQGQILSMARVKYGELKTLHAELNGASSFRLYMKDAAGGSCPADWLEPEIVYEDGSVEHPGERGEDLAELGIEFEYGGVPFDPAVWKHAVTGKDSRYHHVWVSPDGRLELRAEARIFEDFQVVEIIPSLAAAGKETTGLVENFHLTFRKRIYGIPHCGGARYREKAPLLQPELILHRNYGSRSTGTDYLALETRMAGRHGMNEVVMDTDEGRSSAVWLPFFQIELPEDRRYDFAVFWPGAWESRIRFTAEDRFEATAGLHETRFVLHGGEEIRQPGIAVHYAAASEADCSNEFRRFMTAHHLPRDSRGGLLLPPAAMMFSGTMPNQMLQDYLRIVEKYDLPVEVFWADAGWYGADRKVPLELHQSDWGKSTGDWRVNQTIHPGGFRPVADELHRSGRRFLLWVEPERAHASAKIVRDHPEYFIPPPSGSSSPNMMLNIGDETVRKYITETVAGLIGSEGVDCYREDFNLNTLPYWREMDSKTPCRTGIAESRFITGFLKFWQDLRRDYPDMLIDNCASGGRRIDMDTLAMSIPLWRSDFLCFTDIGYLPEANQIHFDGLSRWFPFHTCGTFLRGKDDYAFFSGALGSLLLDLCDRLAFQPKEDAIDFVWLRGRLKTALRMRKYLTGNYYRLTEHPEDFRNFYAMELNDPAEQSGYAAVFRRECTPDPEICPGLREIDEAADYEVENQHGERETVSGKQLADWNFVLPEPRSCQILFFRRLN